MVGFLVRERESKVWILVRASRIGILVRERE